MRRVRFFLAVRLQVIAGNRDEIREAMRTTLAVGATGKGFKEFAW